MSEVHLSGERIVFFNCRDLFQRLHPCLVIPEAQLQHAAVSASETGPLKAVHSSRHKWPGGLVNEDSGRLSESI